MLLSSVATLALLAGCGGGGAGSGQSGDGDETPESLRLAVTDLQGLEELQRDFGPFQEELEEVFDMEVEFFPVSNRGAAAAALESDRVDLVLTGPAEYVIMRERADAEPVISLTRPGYRSAIVVYADSGIESAEDLEGKSIAMSDAGSTSGHLGPCKVLQDAGLDCEEDVEVMLLGDAYTQAFLSQEVDALADSPLDIEEMREQGDLSEEEAPIIAKGPDLPSDVFVASAALPEEFVEEIGDKMIENEQDLIDSILESGANDKYEESELVPAEDSDYDYIREAYESIGVDDFTEFVGD